jgi:hypothetical protein
MSLAELARARLERCGTESMEGKYMRALVISEVHSNPPALDAVLSAAPTYDEVWNLGDIVGYGANPNEVTSKVRSLGGIVVRGNHDRACSGVMARSKLLNFRRDAYSAAIWTQSALSEDNREWLASCPAVQSGRLNAERCVCMERREMKMNTFSSIMTSGLCSAIVPRGSSCMVTRIGRSAGLGIGEQQLP